MTGESFAHRWGCGGSCRAAVPGTRERNAGSDAGLRSRLRAGLLGMGLVKLLGVCQARQAALLIASASYRLELPPRAALQNVLCLVSRAGLTPKHESPARRASSLADGSGALPFVGNPKRRLYGSKDEENSATGLRKVRKKEKKP